jgi:acetoin utilization deacetylase AcuC-like enzyme
MKLGYYSHTEHLAHEVGDMHPEHPMRIIAIEHQLESTGLLQDLQSCPIDNLDHADLVRAHSHGYLDQLARISPANGTIYADKDTPMAVGSLKAAYQAAAAVTTALDDIMMRRIDRAFCSVRPPGHHATRKQTMGFCFLNNIAIAALKAVDFYGLERVAVIDFDVHQANGTIDILQGDERFLICSSFQHPAYPYSHWQNIYPNVVNIPLDPNSAGIDMRRAVEQQWLTALQAFKPQLILVSAGFDAHRADPMAELDWLEEDFNWLGRFIADIGKSCASSRILSSLEGGYDLKALAASAHSYISALTE